MCFLLPPPVGGSKDLKQSNKAVLGAFWLLVLQNRDRYRSIANIANMISLFSGQLVRLCCNDLQCYNPLHCGFVFWSTQGHPQRSRCSRCARADSRCEPLQQRSQVVSIHKSWPKIMGIDTVSFFWQHILQGTY